MTMIRTLEEAIAHAKEVAEKYKNLAKTYESFKYYGYPKSSITSSHKRCLECATEHEQLAAWLTELAERREADRWIPVSERLPEALQSVLVTSKSGRVYTSYIAHGDWEYGGEVIAWRPLPKPYESEDK